MAREGSGPSARVGLVLAGGISVQFGAAARRDAHAARRSARRRHPAPRGRRDRAARRLPAQAARALARRLGHRRRLRHRDGRDERPLLPVGRPHPARPGRHPRGARPARALGRRLPPRRQPRLGRPRPRRRLPARRRRLRQPRPGRRRLRPVGGRHVGRVHRLQRPYGATLPAGRRAGARHGGRGRAVPAARHRRVRARSCSTRPRSPWAPPSPSSPPSSPTPSNSSPCAACPPPPSRS